MQNNKERTKTIPNNQDNNKSLGLSTNFPPSFTQFPKGGFTAKAKRPNTSALSGLVSSVTEIQVIDVRITLIKKNIFCVSHQVNNSSEKGQYILNNHINV